VTSTDSIYGPTAKLFHWLTAALLTAQYLIGWLLPHIKRGMPPDTIAGLHLSIGVLILGLTLVRYSWRIVHPVPPETGLRRWQRLASNGMHLLLYGLVAATALSGWINASMRGWTITLFDVLELPSFAPGESSLARAIGHWHTTLIWILLLAIVMHVLAALAHLLLLRDRVMDRMLPRGSSPHPANSNG
jgi:cytochrome b561